MKHYKQTASTNPGFTIVELLIVIVVIAILAAISIVAYNGIQDRVQLSAISNDLSSFKKKLELYKVNNNHYPASIQDLEATEISVTRNAYDTTGFNLYYCYNTSTDQFAATARTATSKTVRSISSLYELKHAGNLGSAATCQSIDLPGGYDDPNAFSSNGYNFSTSNWASWVK